MSVHTAAPGPTRPPTARLSLLRAAAIAADGAQRADAERNLSLETVQALTDAGLPAHFVPHRWGGTEGTFAALLENVALLAQDCTSSAWCAALWAAHGRFCAYLPAEGQREIWQSSPDTRIAAAIMPPTGSAEPAPEGWTVSGSWRMASGVSHSSWVLVAATATTPQGRSVRCFAIPRAQVSVEDTWNGTGLRATASHSVSVRDVHVPDRLSFDLSDLIAGTPAPGRAACHAVPAHLVGGMIFCASALGAARGAVARWARWAAETTATSGGPRTDDAVVRETLAVASCHIDAAGLLLERIALRADTAAATGAVVATSGRDAAVATRMLADAVDRLLRTGGHLAQADSELQRAWRDVHTIATHAVLRVGTVAPAFAAAGSV